MLSSTSLARLGNLIENVCLVLNSVGIPYWLDRGTLLGAARDGRIIPYDDDVDIAMHHEDLERAKKAMEEHVSEQDYLLGWKSIGTPRFLRFTGRHIDEGPYKGMDWKPYVETDGGPLHADFTELRAEQSANGTRLRDPYTAHSPLQVNVPESVVLPLQSCSMEGHACKCPGDVNAYLSAQYGSNWHVPQSLDGVLSKEHGLSYVNRVLDKPASFLTTDMKADLSKMRATLTQM